jgi:tetratricopeptide (TPR) repeat protein
MVKNSLLFLLITAISLLALNPAESMSAADLVATGNKLYLAGMFDQALKAYEQAESEGQSAEIHYNKGNVYFRMADYKHARESYEKAQTASGDFFFGSKCFYNLGSTYFQEAEAARKEDNNRAAELYELSLRNYREAFRLNPGLTEAGRSIESVRIALRSLLDGNKKEKTGRSEPASPQNTADLRRGELNAEPASSSKPDNASKPEPVRAPVDGQPPQQPASAREQVLTDSSISDPSRMLRNDTQSENDSPHTIFDEEKENRRKTAHSFRSADQLVEKDW